MQVFLLRLRTSTRSLPTLSYFPFFLPHFPPFLEWLAPSSLLFFLKDTRHWQTWIGKERKKGGRKSGEREGWKGGNDQIERKTMPEEELTSTVERVRKTESRKMCFSPLCKFFLHFPFVPLPFLSFFLLSYHSFLTLFSTLSVSSSDFVLQVTSLLLPWFILRVSFQ